MTETNTKKLEKPYSLNRVEFLKQLFAIAEEREIEWDGNKLSDFKTILGSKAAKTFKPAMWTAMEAQRMNQEAIALGLLQNPPKVVDQIAHAEALPLEPPQKTQMPIAAPQFARWKITQQIFKDFSKAKMELKEKMKELIPSEIFDSLVIKGGDRGWAGIDPADVFETILGPEYGKLTKAELKNAREKVTRLWNKEITLKANLEAMVKANKSIGASFPHLLLNDQEMFRHAFDIGTNPEFGLTDTINDFMILPGQDYLLSLFPEFVAYLLLHYPKRTITDPSLAHQAFCCESRYIKPVHKFGLVATNDTDDGGLALAAKAHSTPAPAAKASPPVWLQKDYDEFLAFKKRYPKNYTTPTNVDSTLKLTNRESKYKQTTNNKPKNKSKINLAAAITNSIEGVALDSGCTDSSYRTSDAITHNIDIKPVTNNNLKITTAGGEGINSYGEGILKINNNKDNNQGINIFENNQLTVGMHAMNTFTNHPANCTVILDKFGFKVINPNNQIIRQGTKGEHEKMWFMPTDVQNLFPTVHFASANIFIKHEPQAIFVAYQSACFLNPPDSTFEKAAQLGYFGNLPKLTSKMIRDNRPNSIGTALGHLNRLRQNLRSTKKPPAVDKKRPTQKTTTNPPTPTNATDKKYTPIPNFEDDNESNNMQNEEEMISQTKQLSDISPEERKALAIYFDATGKFPFQSEEGFEYVLISVYKNYIHAEPMIDRTGPTYVKAYRAAINFFQSKGHTFSVGRLDNETSELL
jgi:hypothetical protein